MIITEEHYIKYIEELQKENKKLKEMIEDERNYVDNTSSVRFIVEEHQMK